MNKLFLLSLIFSCNLAFANCSYSSQLKYLWDKACYEKSAATKEFLPQNLEEFLTSSAEKLKEGDKLILAFYPTQCGFDTIAEETHAFTEMQEFYSMVTELGYKVVYCAPERHFAEFESHEELESFMQTTFSTHLDREETPLRVPTKIIFVELQKLN
ncbi:MAG: hypothetical protein P0S96_03070 [Simkaniaceae bacterium]|nr:hypothetical protein [Candidatus Sacchlamyda saccharinae]